MTALAAAQSCTLVAKPNPLSSERVFTHVPAGQTLAEMIGSNASHSLSIQVGGREVPRELWVHTRPKPGQTIHATNYPQGGNAGKYVRVAALIALAYFSGGLSTALTGTEYGVFAGASASFVQAGIMLVGSLALTPMIGHAREVAA
jgi:hypothetical protein